jgi:hypothetical protein
MKIKSVYTTRSIGFVEVHQHKDWQVKVYRIAIKKEYVLQDHIQKAIENLDNWLSNSKIYDLDTYKIATLIIHEGKEGCFAIINWWIDENMLQNFVYLMKKGEPDFKLFSGNGIITCVWELAVLWHERNAWVKHVLMQNENPDYQGYLKDQLNIDL